MGYVAAAFDELLGLAQSLSGAPGMTGTLSVRYESPTPLHTPLRLTGRLVGVERRKIFTEGEIYAGDTLTARAEGIFISLRPGAFLGMLVDRQTRRGPRRLIAARRRRQRWSAIQRSTIGTSSARCSSSPDTSAASTRPPTSGIRTFTSPSVARSAPPPFAGTNRYMPDARSRSA